MPWVSYNHFFNNENDSNLVTYPVQRFFVEIYGLRLLKMIKNKLSRNKTCFQSHLHNLTLKSTRSDRKTILSLHLQFFVSDQSHLGFRCRPIIAFLYSIYRWLKPLDPNTSKMLHWLKIEQRIQYKIISLTYNLLQIQRPS